MPDFNPVARVSLLVLLIQRLTLLGLSYPHQTYKEPFRYYRRNLASYLELLSDFWPSIYPLDLNRACQGSNAIVRNRPLATKQNLLVKSTNLIIIEMTAEEINSEMTRLRDRLDMAFTLDRIGSIITRTKELTFLELTREQVFELALINGRVLGRLEMIRYLKNIGTSLPSYLTFDDTT